MDECLFYTESTHDLDESAHRWEHGKLSALWRHLLAKDCALMESAPPLLVANIVRVRDRSRTVVMQRTMVKTSE